MTLAAGNADLRLGQTVNYSGNGIVAGTTTIASINGDNTEFVLASAVVEAPADDQQDQQVNDDNNNNVVVSIPITLQIRVQDAFCSKFYADSDKVKALTNPTWMENESIDAQCTIAGASFRSVMNVGNTALEPQAIEDGLDATNHLTMAQDTDKFTRTITIGMTTPLKYNVSAKPSMVYHPDDDTTGPNRLEGSKAGKVRTMNVTAEAGVSKALGIFQAEANGILGNRMVLFTDKTDHIIGNTQGTAFENRMDLDTTPEASTSTPGDNDAENDTRHDFVITEEAGKATLTLSMLDDKNAFYRVKDEANIVLADKTGVAVGHVVTQGAAQGTVVFVSTIGASIRVEYTAFVEGRSWSTFRS